MESQNYDKDYVKSKLALMDDELDELFRSRWGMGDKIEVLSDYFGKQEGFEEVGAIVNDVKNRYEYYCKQYFNGEISNEIKDRLYQDLSMDLRRAYHMARSQWFVMNDKTFHTLHNRGNAIQSLDFVCDKLETLFSDIAMLNLEEDSQERDQKREALDIELNNWRNKIFSYFVSSVPGSNSCSDFMRFFDSGMIDGYTKQLLVSALTLATLNFYDQVKVDALYQIVKGDYEMEIQQRAIVGFILVGVVYREVIPSYLDYLNELSKSKEMRFVIADIQKVMHYENKAEMMGDKLITSMMNNLFFSAAQEFKKQLDQHFDDVVEENDEQAKLDSEFENTANLMSSCEEDGADMYFSQFKHLKSFGFFHSLYNWFVPYYIENSALKDVRGAIKKHEAIVKGVCGSTKMCDSDFYSFLLSLKNISKTQIGVLSSETNQIVSEAEVDDKVLSQGFDFEKKLEAKEIRHGYLQSLYRFFMLAPMRSSFKNPFEFNHWHSFLVNNNFHNPIWDDVRLTLGRYFAKREDYSFANTMFALIEKPTKEQLMIKALAYCEGDLTDSAIDLLEKMMNEGVDKKTCLKLLLKCHEDLMDKEIPHVVSQLLELEDDKEQKLDFCLREFDYYFNTEQIEKALSLVYKLDQEYPKNELVECRMAEAMMFTKPYSFENAKRADEILMRYSSKVIKDIKEMGQMPKPESEEEAHKRLLDMLSLMLDDFITSHDRSWDQRIDRRLAMCKWVLEGPEAASMYFVNSINPKEPIQIYGCTTLYMDSNDITWLEQMGIRPLEIEMMKERYLRPDIIKKNGRQQ